MLLRRLNLLYQDYVLKRWGQPLNETRVPIFFNDFKGKLYT